MSATAAAIHVQDVSVGYRRVIDPPGSVKELVARTLRRSLRVERAWALREVTFSIQRGEIVGVIGSNGSGKSTLLRAIAGVLPPTAGRVIVRGHMTPVLDIGIGLHPDATGRECIVFYGSLLGRDPQLMRRAAPEIAEWAGLSNYLDRPVRTYSAGMVARLAFAAVTDTTADVLLLDEVLSVGDAAFQSKSLERLHQLTRSGSTVIMVTHDLEAVQEHADRAMWLDAGTMRKIGTPAAVIAAYGDAGARAQIP